MITLISRLLVGIVSYSLALGIIVYAVPGLGVQLSSPNPALALFLMGVILWILFAIVKRAIGWLLLPIHIITLGSFALISNSIITVVLLYVFGGIVDAYGSLFATSIVLGSFVQNLGVAFILSLLSVIIQKIL